MSYPVQCERTYVNPSGNLSASGYYRSSLTQETVNMLPPWMSMRQNNRSVGQQFLSTPAMEMKRLENRMNKEFGNKFLDTADLSEPDVIYRVTILGNVDMLHQTYSGIRCVAAPSGASPSGVRQIELQEVNNLQDFYYNVLPTRLEAVSSGSYASTVCEKTWNSSPSGIIDTEESHVDVWGKKHDISWCYDSGLFRKQDTETMEDYETYTINGSGTPTDLWFYTGQIWWVGALPGGRRFLNISSSKTVVPKKTSLDLLASYDITDINIQASGVLISEEGRVWVCDDSKTVSVEIGPRYDYFIVDRNNGYIYFREDYRNSGVFISNK